MTFVKLTALVLTALILIPSGAHLFELPGKIDLDRDAYFTVQGIYAGWADFAVPIIGAFMANLTLAVMQRRRDPKSARWAPVSAVMIACSLAIFFIWVFPGNQATVDWTVRPDDWQALRLDWEYVHAASAVVVFMAFLATARAATAGADRAGPAG